jgi:hypothetical protein
MATKGAFMTGLAFAAALCTAGQAPAAQDEARTLVLHVDNYARIPPQSLARAEREAARVYEAAGVRTVWIHGDDEASTSDAGGKQLRVLLLGRTMTDRKAEIEAIGPEVLGRAARSTGRAYVFAQRIVETALLNGRSAELMLGRVMAHEIGHLLLPEGSHSRKGIMRAHVGLFRPKLEVFTAPQAQQILMALNR